MPVTVLNTALNATAPADQANMVTLTKREPINSSVKTSLQTELKINETGFTMAITVREIDCERDEIDFMFKSPYMFPLIFPAS